MTLRAAASTASQGTPGRAAASAASCACRSISNTRFILSVGLPEHERPADIRLVALDVAAAVDQQDRPFADRLRRDRAVGQGGVLADLHAGAAFEAQLRVRRRRPDRAKSFCVMPSFSAL